MSNQYGMPTNDDCVLAIGDGNVLVRLPLVMYVSSFCVRERSTRKILYPEGISEIVSKPHVSRKEESVGGIMFLLSFRSRFVRGGSLLPCVMQ